MRLILAVGNIPRKRELLYGQNYIEHVGVIFIGAVAEGKIRPINSVNFSWSGFSPIDGLLRLANVVRSHRVESFECQIFRPMCLTWDDMRGGRIE